MSRRKSSARIVGQFIAHSRAMRESPAWNMLPDNARRLLDRLEREHMRHAGNANGALPCTYSDFEAAGLRRQSVSLAIRQAAGLGFLEVMQKGRQAWGAVRGTPSLYRLTYVYGREGSPAPIPTNEWKRVKSEQQAVAILEAAALNKSARHVTRGKEHRARVEEQQRAA